MLTVAGSCGRRRRNGDRDGPHRHGATVWQCLSGPGAPAPLRLGRDSVIIPSPTPTLAARRGRRLSGAGLSLTPLPAALLVGPGSVSLSLTVAPTADSDGHGGLTKLGARLETHTSDALTVSDIFWWFVVYQLYDKYIFSDLKTSCLHIMYVT